MYRQPKMQLISLNFLVFFVAFFMVQNVNALAIISLLEDSVTAETTAWVESEPGTPPWTSSYNGSGYPDSGSTGYRTLTDVVSSTTVYNDDGSGDYGIGGNYAAAVIDSSSNGVTLVNRVSSISDPWISSSFEGYAQSETQLDWLFRVDGEDVSIHFDGTQSQGSIGYSLYDVTTDSLLGRAEYGNSEPFRPDTFSLLQDHVYRMLLNSVSESAGDPPESLIHVGFNSPGASTMIVRAVPEPDSFVLMGLGLVGLGFFVRNRQRKKYKE